MPDAAIAPFACDAMLERWRAAAETADVMRDRATLIEGMANAPEHLA
jgi:hypothetical protein